MGGIQNSHVLFSVSRWTVNVRNPVSLIDTQSFESNLRDPTHKICQTITMTFLSRDRSTLPNEWNGSCNDLIGDFTPKNDDASIRKIPAEKQVVIAGEPFTLRGRERKHRA
jgi:hypothetical protein